eukprot:2189254-Heterocapsa_arctica.AAC.1
MITGQALLLLRQGVAVSLWSTFLGGDNTVGHPIATTVLYYLGASCSEDSKTSSINTAARARGSL